MVWTVVAAGCLALLGLVLLWPTGDAPSLGFPQDDYYDATVVSVSAEECESREILASVDCFIATFEDCRRLPEPVCSRPNGSTAQGVCDLAGNVSEWVQDCYEERLVLTPEDGAPAPCRFAGQGHVIKGGSWDDLPLRLSVEWRANQGGANPKVGFRVVRDLPAP